MTSPQVITFVNKDKGKFSSTLKKRVDTYFKENNLSKHANSTMVVKTVVLLLSYIAPFILLLALQPGLGISLLLWTIMGLGLAGIGMNIMHDAIHGAYSAKKSANTLLGYSVNLIGGAVLNWKIQHNILHHTYTNIASKDLDIQGKNILRFNPHNEAKKHHRFQWLYAIFFYGITTLYWVTVKDFVQYFKFIKEGLNKDSKAKNNITFLRIIFMKVSYFVVFLVVPTLLFSIPFGQVIAGFLVMHFVAGTMLTVVFQLAHTVEGTSHPMPNEHGAIENDWAIHQMNTTSNFSRHSKLISWYVGGLNFQVEHHLFPKICHVHYPKIAPIVQQTAEEFGVPYLEKKTFLEALNSHKTLLKRLGKLPDLNEALG